MKRAMAATLFSLGILIHSAMAAPPQNPSQAVPVQFQGDWNSKMEDCGTGNNDSVLSIDAHWIRFYESGGPILAVVVRGKNLSLIAQLTSAEDEKATWDAPMKFELSPNGAVLTDRTDVGESLTRYKCPSHDPYRPKKHALN